MSCKTLLFLNANSFHAYAWKAGALSGAQYFANDVGGHEQFAAFLQAHRDPVYLLTDMVEEDFRHETVPHLHGSERSALIRRKLEQYYRNTPFRQAMTLRRHKDGRHDDDMLFSALTNPVLIASWLNIMLLNNIPLAGIYSIPYISAPLIKDRLSGCLLLLSWEKHAGLRQTYFDAKQLSLSRLTPIDGSLSFCAAVGTEAARTQQYLNNLSLLPSDRALNVVIICHPDDRRELESRLGNDDNMRYEYLDIQELGKQVGSKAVYVDSDATPLFLHLLAAQPPRNNYAVAEQTHLLRLLHIRHSLFWLSATLAAGCMMLTASNIMESIVLHNDTQILEAQAGGLSQRTRQIIQNFPGALASASDMKTAVMLSRNLDGISSRPRIILDGLARTLDGFSSIRIDKLSWQTNSEAKGMASVAVSQGGAAAMIPAQIILMSGELTEFTGGYRTALDYLERFRKELTQCGYSVTVLAMPLDVSPQGSIAADTGDGNNKPAQFSLKIFWQTPT